MKHDITGENNILSRKIKAVFLRVLVLLTFMAGPSAAFSHASFELLITPEKLYRLDPAQILLIDTRPAWKYFLGHIPGAINLPNWKEFTVNQHGVAGLINQDKNLIVNKLRKIGIDHNKTIVIYGETRNKWRTDGRFFWMLEYYGFKKVAVLRGGYDSWKQFRKPVTGGHFQSPAPSKLTVQDLQFNPEVYADLYWVRSRLGSKTVAIIDNRERSEFDGATPYGSPRGGHIPGAIHIDWREFFAQYGLLKNRDELEKILNRYGITRNQEIMVYCTGGVRSAMAYFVFRTLGMKVRNYDGSWWDWSHNPAAPVEN